MAKRAYIGWKAGAVVINANPDLSQRELESTIRKAAKLEQKFERKYEKHVDHDEYMNHVKEYGGPQPKIEVRGLETSGLAEKNFRETLEGMEKQSSDKYSSSRDEYKNKMWLADDPPNMGTSVIAYQQLPAAELPAIGSQIHKSLYKKKVERDERNYNGLRYISGHYLNDGRGKPTDKNSYHAKIK